MNTPTPTTDTFKPRRGKLALGATLVVALLGCGEAKFDAHISPGSKQAGTALTQGSKIDNSADFVHKNSKAQIIVPARSYDSEVFLQSTYSDNDTLVLSAERQFRTPSITLAYTNSQGTIAPPSSVTACFDSEGQPSSIMYFPDDAVNPGKADLRSADAQEKDGKLCARIPSATRIFRVAKTLRIEFPDLENQPLAVNRSSELSIRIMDELFNIIPFGQFTPTSSSTDAVLPSRIDLSSLDSGVATIQAAFSSSGSHKLTLTGSDGTSGSASLEVAPFAVHRIRLVADLEQTVAKAGQAFFIDVSLVDTDDVALDLPGREVKLSLPNGGIEGLPESFVFSPSDAGTRRLGPLIATETGIIPITAEYTESESINFTTTGDLVVTAGIPQRYVATVPASIAAGSAFNMILTAYDGFGNRVTNLSTNITLLAGGGDFPTLGNVVFDENGDFPVAAIKFSSAGDHLINIDDGRRWSVVEIQQGTSTGGSVIHVD